MNEEEELRQSLDLHQLISEQMHPIEGEQPPITADQVIEEIDEMMQVIRRVFQLYYGVVEKGILFKFLLSLI